MADTEDTNDSAPTKKGRLGLLIGIAAMLAGGGGGFHAVRSGLILGGAAEVAAGTEAHGEAGAAQATPFAEGDRGADAAVAFLPVDPLVISLAGTARGRHLRFRAQLEVPSDRAAEVERLMPRVVDVMNGYLRAVDPADLESPGGLAALRAQMLRRVELVVGHGQVSDVLVMEFVLS